MAQSASQLLNNTACFVVDADDVLFAKHVVQHDIHHALSTGVADRVDADEPAVAKLTVLDLAVTILALQSVNQVGTIPRLQYSRPVETGWADPTFNTHTHCVRGAPQPNKPGKRCFKVLPSCQVAQCKVSICLTTICCVKNIGWILFVAVLKNFAGSLLNQPSNLINA